MLTVMTLEPINICPVALPSPKGFGQGLARPLAHPPHRLVRVLLLMRLIRTLILLPPFCFRYGVLFLRLKLSYSTRTPYPTCPKRKVVGYCRWASKDFIVHVSA